MTSKTNDQNIVFSINGYDSIYTVDLTGWYTRYIHIRNNLVSTRHLRPWFAKHKMSVNDFSQTIGPEHVSEGYRYSLI